MAWISISEAMIKAPRLFFQRKMVFSFDGIPLVAKDISFPKIMNLTKVGLDALVKSNKARSLPPIIQVEPTNMCNLSCPLCPTGANLTSRLKGMMTLKTFHRILEELGDTLIAVYLYSYGEPFMNPDLHRMVRACTTRDILTLTTTNGHFIKTLDDALQIVDAGLTVLITAIDGTTQTIYESYRKQGELEKVKRAVMLVEEAKDVRKSEFPYTVVRSIVTQQNQHEIPQLEKLARDLGVNMFSAKSIGCLPGSEQYHAYEPSEKGLRRFRKKGDTASKPMPVKCPFPFRQPTIFWDGTLVGSEHDFKMELPFGTIGEKPFSILWNGPQAIQLRKRLRKGHDRPSFCAHCPHEDKMRRSAELFCREFKSLTK
jgi:MoaA/NifB/PqqE/SkfB family radical SAM enzyme